MISYCGQFITEFVVRKIKENLFFSIFADEASDCSNREELLLVIRYVDSDCVTREEFLGFLHCDLGLSGKVLVEKLLVGLINLGLYIRNCCGQSYNRAAAVSGHMNGLFAHIVCIKNVFDQIKEISYVFKFSEPQQKMLINSINEHAPGSQKKGCLISVLLDGLKK